MDLIKWDRPDPLDSLTHIQREMSDLLDFLSSTPPKGTYINAEFPPIIVSTFGDNVIVRAEIPGIKVNDLDVQVVNDVLTIKGERKTSIDVSKMTYLRRERPYGTFARAIVLPERVDAEKVTASYKNGVLVVTLPKAPESKPKQVIIKKS
ncbi:MAG TPA: Hsp20/alpha crystallin family protein [Candidatus Wujingus californicus]|uniref:Hsp20/alpha crystallin family protein n=1 Tax=Candidatus Wujingus californicus TaxID=3367618 RepID=UPI001D4FD718|nr:Hsp20/alpha crystallin family protein [Planctomycetota bacterium]MDO8132362.1 Hsp20/alpha crystallin family protein [Candidatus Brocadiales bacterium]